MGLPVDPKLDFPPRLLPVKGMDPLHFGPFHRILSPSFNHSLLDDDLHLLWGHRPEW